ncbi:type VII toxin-antitoxin system MntA family adenylyltransferase antitoxin [Hippea sp. KM1]|uniref:type VII toxin-antitoxin system MntA family adenylyltransferase antitoxin n=1 Tax=Hippea sp. KM1 TaxID=944481 RepID=UPI00046CD30C|nr:nucleotidyltransferase domain-containing protein [Hippea sp. KM1]
MKKKIKMDRDKKEEIIGRIKDYLDKRKEVLFAYIFGSFVRSDEFSDIDIALYVDGDFSLRYEFEIEDDLEAMLKIPVDVRIINKAPVSFSYGVLKDGLLIKDNDIRSDFQVMKFKEYMDYVHLRDTYIRDRDVAR